MINILFKLFLTFNATFLFLIIFYIKEGVSCIIHLFSFIFFSFLSIYFCRWLGKDSFKKGQTEFIEYAHNSFLPTYLTYFFVALSISDYRTFIFIYLIIFAFTFASQIPYYNPVFVLLGYKFYNIKTKNGISIFLISRKIFKKAEEVDIDVVYRINDYTFIDVK